MAAADIRSVESYGIIGFNRTGKTTLAILIAEAWKKNRPGQDIVAFDPQGKFKGIANKFLKDYDDGSGKDWLDHILELEDALVILDELRMIHPSHQTDRRFIKFLSMRAEKKVDLIYIVHSPKLVLDMLDGYTSHYLIFYTQARASSWKDKIANYENCVAASSIVKRYTSKYGMGDYPNFPYVHVDNGAGEISCINMDQDKVQQMLSG